MRHRGNINVKALIILVLVLVLGGVGVIGGHYVRKRSTADAALERGRAAAAKGDWLEASRQLRVYLSAYPADEQALDEYAAANLNVEPREVDQLLAAIAAYRSLLRNHRPDDVELMHKLTRLYLRIRDYDEAEYIARQWIDAAPDDADATISLGKALVAKRDLDEARDRLTALIENSPQVDVEAYRLLSVVAAKSGGSDLSAATAWLDKCIAVHPDSAKAHALRAHLHRLARDGRDAALADLKTASSLEAQDPLVHVILCEEWLAWGEFDKAQAALAGIDDVTPQQLAEFDVQESDLVLARYTWTGKLAMERGDENTSAIAASGLADLEGHHRDLFLPIAVRLYLGDRAWPEAWEALKEYEQVLDRPGGGGSQQEHFLLLKARLLAAEGEAHEVVELLATIADRGAEEPDTLSVLAWAFDRDGNRDRAVKTLERYLARAPYDVDGHLRLARMQRGQDWRSVEQHAAMAEKVQAGLEAKTLRLEAQLHLAAADGDMGRILTLGAEADELLAAHPEDLPLLLLAVDAASVRDADERAVSLARDAVKRFPDKPLAHRKLVAALRASDDEAAALQACEAAQHRFPADVPILKTYARLLTTADRGDEAEVVLADARSSICEEDATGRDCRDLERALLDHLLAAGEEAEATSIMWDIAAVNPDDLDIRERLLLMPKVRKDTAKANQLIAEMKTIEEKPADSGDAEEHPCRRWAVERALLDLETVDNSEIQAASSEWKRSVNACLIEYPKWEKPVVAMATLHARTGQPDLAEQVYRQAIAANPGNTRLSDRLLALLINQQRFMEAANVMETGVSHQEFDRHRLAVALGQGDIETAIEDLEQHIATAKDDAASRTLLAQLLYARDRDADAALQMLDESLAIEPDNTATLAAKVKVLTVAKRPDEALALLNAEVKRRGDFAAILLRARYQEGAGSLDDAAADLERLTRMPDNAAAGFALLGQFYHRHGQVDEAVAALRKAVELDPSNVGTSRALMHILVTQDDDAMKQEGREMLAALRKELPQDASLLRIETELSLAEGELAPDVAVQQLREVVKLDPQDAPAWRRLIALLHEAGETQDAYEVANRALQFLPGNSELELAAAYINLELGHTDKALDLASAVARRESKNLDARLILVQLALREGDTRAAAEWADQATRLAGNFPPVQLARTDVLLARGNLEGAIENLVSYVDDEGGERSVRSLLRLAELLILTKDYDRAGKRLDQATALAAGAPEVQLARLRWHAAAGRFDLLGKEATALPNDAQSAPLRLAAVYMLTGSGKPAALDEAQKLVQTLLDTFPNDAAALAARAQFEIARHDRPAAIATYRHILEVAPMHELALNDLAYLLADTGRPDSLTEAYELATQGIGQYPTNAHLRDTRAMVLIGMGRLGEAQRDLEYALLLPGVPNPTKVSLLHRLSEVLDQQGLTDEARDRREQAEQLEIQGSLPIAARTSNGNAYGAGRR